MYVIILNHDVLRNGWGASAIEALSTGLLMGDRAAVNRILKFVPTIDFTKTKTDDSVSLFETTIRYIGGMLSGYDLLKGPLAHMTNNTKGVDALLTQAKSLADSLKYAFDTPTGIPYNNLNFSTHGHDNSTTNGLATIGSLVLEWTRLSDLTGDSEYTELTKRGESYLLSPKPPSSEPFPGLVGSEVDIATGDFVDSYISWLGGQDSFYEYLIKMYLYDPDRFASYKDRWVLAADSTIKHLTSHPSTRPDITFIDYYDNGSFYAESEHLTCFDGGNFLLGGALLGRDDFIDFGLSLVDGCRDTYTATLTGIGPEIFSWNDSTVPANQTDFYDKNGFYITDGTYDLRPETLESYYYAYRITGLKKVCKKGPHNLLLFGRPVNNIRTIVSRLGLGWIRRHQCHLSYRFGLLQHHRRKRSQWWRKG